MSKKQNNKQVQGNKKEAPKHHKHPELGTPKPTVEQRRAQSYLNRGMVQAERELGLCEAPVAVAKVEPKVENKPKGMEVLVSLQRNILEGKVSAILTVIAKKPSSWSTTFRMGDTPLNISSKGIKVQGKSLNLWGLSDFEFDYIAKRVM